MKAEILENTAHIHHITSLQWSFTTKKKTLHRKFKNLMKKSNRLVTKKNFVIHTAPLIRKEEMFNSEPPNKRRALFTKLFYFTLKCDIQYKTFAFEKRQFENTFKLEGRMAKEMSEFIRENLEFFQSFENVILYYDNGQHELNRILNVVFSTELSHYEARKVLPKNYKLFQTADLICTLQLLALKCRHGGLSKSEYLIFHNERELKKQFLKPIAKKEFKLCVFRF